MKPEGEPQMWDPSLWDIKSRKGKRSSGDWRYSCVVGGTEDCSNVQEV